jgi:hypothetical protein
LVLIDAVVPDPLETALLLAEERMTEALLQRDLRGGAACEMAARERYRSQVRAATDFVARPQNIPVSLLLSEKTAQEQPRNAWMVWSLMARAGMTCHLIPGDHFSVLESAGMGGIAARLVEEIQPEIPAVFR